MTCASGECVATDESKYVLPSRWHQPRRPRVTSESNVAKHGTCHLAKTNLSDCWTQDGQSWTWLSLTQFDCVFLVDLFKRRLWTWVDQLKNGCFSGKNRGPSALTRLTQAGSAAEPGVGTQDIATFGGPKNGHIQWSGESQWETVERNVERKLHLVEKRFKNMFKKLKLFFYIVLNCSKDPWWKKVFSNPVSETSKQAMMEPPPIERPHSPWPGDEVDLWIYWEPITNWEIYGHLMIWARLCCTYMFQTWFLDVSFILCVLKRFVKYR